MTVTVLTPNARTNVAEKSKKKKLEYPDTPVYYETFCSNRCTRKVFVRFIIAIHCPSHYYRQFVSTEFYKKLCRIILSSPILAINCKTKRARNTRRNPIYLYELI